MHIEVWKGSGKQPWRWDKVNRGKIVSDAEGFPSKGNAMRAAKAEVRGTIGRPTTFATWAPGMKGNYIDDSL